MINLLELTSPLVKLNDIDSFKKWINITSETDPLVSSFAQECVKWCGENAYSVDMIGARKENEDSYVLIVVFTKGFNFDNTHIEKILLMGNKRLIDFKVDLCKLHDGKTTESRVRLILYHKTDKLSNSKNVNSNNNQESECEYLKLISKMEMENEIKSLEHLYEGIKEHSVDGIGVTIATYNGIKGSLSITDTNPKKSKRIQSIMAGAMTMKMYGFHMIHCTIRDEVDNLVFRFYLPHKTTLDWDTIYALYALDITNVTWISVSDTNVITHKGHSFQAMVLTVKLKENPDSVFSKNIKTIKIESRTTSSQPNTNAHKREKTDDNEMSSQGKHKKRTPDLSVR